MTIEELKALGVDTAQGLQRCMNNEGFYFKLVGMAVRDAHFGQLFEAVERGDLDAAFEAAHALKGTTGNLALTTVYKPVCELTELLRERKDMDYSGLVSLIREEREKLLGICGE